MSRTRVALLLAVILGVGLIQFARAQLVLPGGGGGTSTPSISFPPSLYITGGTQWYQPVTGGLVPAAGATSFNNTLLCFFGGVGGTVTIKQLSSRIVTGGPSGSLWEAVIASYGSAAAPSNSPVIVDYVSASQAATGSGANISSNLTNGTDTLSNGILYGWCSIFGGGATAPVATSYNAANTAMSALVGTSSQTNAMAANAQPLGKSAPLTFNATPSSTFGTIGTQGNLPNLSAMTDQTATVIPQISFLVN